ncbi:hypothetical protein HC723_15560 [Vibrio sp. S11_S32]|uniref:hypothetical protein n=1 Tax=Vibrio sp. S11_S32 TaxID=2720225 RepID=UPI001680FF2F|nr:hypothetical protein [Vibrio sp. S11_S32]MBD1577814.1 hypothetical protein [Vibrio sp. S11_S32]
MILSRYCIRKTYCVEVATEGCLSWGGYVRSRVLAITAKYQANPYFSAFLGPTINETKIGVDFDGALTGGAAT